VFRGETQKGKEKRRQKEKKHSKRGFPAPTRIDGLKIARHSDHSQLTRPSASWDPKLVRHGHNGLAASSSTDPPLFRRLTRGEHRRVETYRADVLHSLLHLFPLRTACQMARELRKGPIRSMWCEWGSSQQVPLGNTTTPVPMQPRVRLLLPIESFGMHFVIVRVH